MPATVDQSTAAYIVATRPCFEDLRQVAAQLAGLLVLAASGSAAAATDRPMLAAARQLYDECLDGIRRAPVTRRTRAHHRYLNAAATAIGGALDSALRAPAHPRTVGVDDILEPLRRGYRQLQLAARELPGFDLVAYERACCSLVNSRSE